jgi:Uma2 family endonuclease
MVATKLLTVDEFEAMALADRVNTWELIWGEVREVPGSGFEHSGVGVAFSAELRQFVRPRDLGVVTGADGTFILSREDRVVLIPDVAFVAKDRLPPADRRQRFFDGSPDLAVEIVSPSNRQSEVAEKVRLWLRFGTRLVWVVDPSNRTIAVWTADGTMRLLGETDELDGGEALPGFRVAIADLFS